MKFLVKYRNNILIFSAYLLLTIVFTYPTAKQLNTAIPIAGGDVYQVVAKINNQAYILQQRGFFYGLSQIYSEGKLTMNTFAAISENLGVPLLATYNIFFLFSFFASACGAYLLAHYFTRNVPASFVAGIVFAFAPFHTYHAMTGHSGTMHQEWLPFFVLFLWQWFETRKIKFAISTFAFLTLIAITEHHLLAFTTIFIAIFIIYQIILNWKFRKQSIPWRRLSVLGGGLLVVIFVFFDPYVKIAVSEENYLDPGIGQAQRYSMSVLDPLITPPWQTFWPGFRATLISAVEKNTPFRLQNIGEGNSSAYVSYTALLLIALFLIFRAWKFGSKDDFRNNLVIVFWLGIVLLFYIFSIGPLIKIGSQKIYMPYFLVYKFAPFFENIRTVGRFYVYSLLGISVLIAYSVAWLQIKFSRKFFWIIMPIITILITIELLQIPFGATSMTYSPFYNRLATESGNFKIIEIPGSSNYDYGSFLRYTNTIHHKESLSGIVTGRELPGQYAFQKNTPLLSALLYDLPKNKKPKFEGDFSDAVVFLNQNNVKYITVSKGGYMKPEAYASVIEFIKKWITTDAYYQDDFIVVFKIPAS